MAVLGATALAGCKRDPGAFQPAPPEGRVVADVVARVGDVSIGAAEVRDRMAADHLDAEAAVEVLIGEAALAAEAQRSGFAGTRDDERRIERLMVRTMLHALEKENAPASVSAEDVREAYAANAHEFQVPERRRSWHILVESQSDAAKALAESILAELRRADDSQTIYARYADGGPTDAGLALKAEKLPAITENAGFEKPYKDALFGAKSEGPLKEVVKTSYGWHAIVVAEIVPGSIRTREEAETEIRERLSQKRRLGAIVSIVQNLEAQGLVRYDEEGVQKLLSMPGLPERAE